MRAAIISVHYHLRPGGVSQVIRSTERILGESGIPHIILSEETIPELGYRTKDPGEYSGLLLKAANQQLGSGAHVWHFHNPCLGKNPALTRSLHAFAQAGVPMILQHHDLAEDGRPNNLDVLKTVAEPYPDSPRITHAFLNRRDRRVFIDAGLPEDRAVILPNPAPTLPTLPTPAAGPAVVLSPMRGIPRKNLGELLLLAAAAPHEVSFLQGSAPRQEEWIPGYETWCTFARSENLPVEFDVFRHDPPRVHFTRATHLLTTSTQEGFGLIHLEGANRRRVIGRRLPHLDLEGFPSDGLYDALVVDGHDFGDFDPDTQRRIIREFREGEREITATSHDRAMPLREWLQEQLVEREPGDASAGLALHSDAAHLKRLTALQARLLNAPDRPVRQLDRVAIATTFQ